MDRSQGTIGQKIAHAAQAYEKRRTKHGRNWVAVFMNEDTTVIALHASLTAEEKILVKSTDGAARVGEFHRQLFANLPCPLLQEIKRISGMDVRDTTAEIAPTTGSVVLLFTTGTVGELPAPRPDPQRQHEFGARLNPRQPDV